nr:universal stress protein A-like protein [Ipomoea batatas]GMD27725.1 universal stress protein A-like protein [Ipomoea batatas]GME19201.1 universal stress protein A-like protein [Ipomoea batatas]
MAEGEISVGQEQMLLHQQKNKVMVAIDDSENSFHALCWTLNNFILHNRNDPSPSAIDSEVLIFTVQPLIDYTFVHAASFGSTPPELMNSLRENQKKMADALLEKATKLCTQYGITPETATEVGDPKEAICEAVERLNVHLLVLGTHSRGALQRAFLGSVSNYCVHHAKCPVLVVRKTAQEST